MGVGGHSINWQVILSKKSGLYLGVKKTLGDLPSEADQHIGRDRQQAVVGGGSTGTVYVAALYTRAVC